MIQLWHIEADPELHGTVFLTALFPDGTLNFGNISAHQARDYAARLNAAADAAESLATTKEPDDA